MDEYLSRLGDPERETLERAREVVRACAPDATERIGYTIPVFAHHGDLVGFAAQKRHLSFYTMSPGLVSEMRDELASVEVSGATIHFTPQAPLPEELIERIVLARMEENASARNG